MRSKNERKMMIKVRGGTALLQIEVGRWQGVRREECVSSVTMIKWKIYVCHWMVECDVFDSVREPLLKSI